MIIVDNVAALREHVNSPEEHKERRLCVLAVTGDEELAAETSKLLGLAPHTSGPDSRRPSVTVFDEQISLVLMVLDQERTQHILRIHARDGGLLVIGDVGTLEDLAPRLGEDNQRRGEDRQRLLARAAAAFAANHSMATRVYAMLGDVLNELDSVVSERLTLVTTIILPLTLATGFFGMNFQWMLDRLGTMQAFIVLGLVIPSLLTVATLLFIRRLTRS